MNILLDFNKFLSKHFTLGVITSLVIFNILTILFQGVITPIILSYADPDKNFNNLNFSKGRYIIQAGTFLKELIIGILILLVVAQFDKLSS